MSGLRSRISASRRRRAHGESSREASAESNDEAGSGLDTDAASVSRLSLRDNGADSANDDLPHQVKRATSVVPDDATEAGTETSNMYDGDVSSAGRRRTPPAAAATHSAAHYNALPRPRMANQTLSSSSSLTFGESGERTSNEAEPHSALDAIPPSPPDSMRPPPVPVRQPSHAHPAAPHGMLGRVSAVDLQQSVRDAIAGRGGPDGLPRPYKINEPPVGRPVRLYSDGVFDLFHYAHALQLRQAKLAFENVHLLVGVCADELCAKHKNRPVLHSEERYESVRNCKWVDEVVEDAPWTIDQAFIDAHRIDYVAHDEEPYVSAGSDDVYKFVKDQGKFLPTRRTSGISTSELLQRIVENWREGHYDVKFDKIGHPELRSHPPSEAGSSRQQASVALSSPQRLGSPTRDEHLEVPTPDT